MSVCWYLFVCLFFAREWKRILQINSMNVRTERYVMQCSMFNISRAWFSRKFIYTYVHDYEWHALYRFPFTQQDKTKQNIKRVNEWARDENTTKWKEITNAIHKNYHLSWHYNFRVRFCFAVYVSFSVDARLQMLRSHKWNVVFGVLCRSNRFHLYFLLFCFW